jgi:hypothetical protein
MKQTENAIRASSVAHATDALQRAQELVDSRPADRHPTGWVHHAHHVGDLAVLAVTLRD